MRRYFDEVVEREEDAEIEVEFDVDVDVVVESAGSWPFVVGGGDRGEADEVEAMISSGESRTAESTSTSIILCTSGVTSVGFHSSSSTSFAERDSRLWWKACKNTLAWLHGKVSAQRKGGKTCLTRTHLANDDTSQANDHPPTNNLTPHNKRPALIEEVQEIWQLKGRMLLRPHGNNICHSGICKFSCRRENIRKFFFDGRDVRTSIRGA